MPNINELVERKIQILLAYPFFQDFMNQAEPDNKLFLDNLRAFSKDLKEKGFTKNEQV